MGSPLSYAAAGANDSLQELIKQRFLEQLQKAKLAEDIRQANMTNVVQTRQLGQGDRRLSLDEQKFGEDTRQFGVTSGQGQQRIDLDKSEQPIKLRLMGAQAGDIERRPTAEQQSRDFTTSRDSAQHGYQMQEIGAQGANALKVANVRHPDAPAMTPQQENEVADAISLIDQIGGDPALNTAVGPVDAYIGKARDLPGVTRFDALHNQLVGKLSLAQAGKLKGQGQISDKERAMLAAAATALTRNLSESDYKAELGKIREQFTRMQHGPTVAPAGGNMNTGGAISQEYDYVPGKGLVIRKPK